ncbi:MAG: T9SS type A sorting domain-containing protein, partial [Bacteroidetes bacterium]|nr:T9SS type A sorting domain-containing protein [Bacteroidota bacterium]
INGAGVIKSLNGGNDWVSSSSGIVGTARMEIAVAPSDTSKIYASTELGDGNATLYVSDDAGATWNPSADAGGNKNWLGGQGWYDNTIAVDPYDATTVYVGGVNIMKLVIGTGTTTTDPQITGVEQVNTSSFWAFVNWGGGFGNGGLDTGDKFAGSMDVITTDYSTVEISFGPGKSQMAHRFTTPGGPGQPATNYTYIDYVVVPFEVWDTDNNQQLMVSFRDESNDGAWDLTEDGREYTFINAVTYNSSTPDPNIAVNAGMQYKNIYSMWTRLPTGGTFDPNNLPSSKIVINWGTITQKNITTTVITDAYGQFGPGPNSISFVHPDHHNLTIIKTNPATQSFRLINGNDGGVTYSDDKGISFTKTLNGYNTTQFYGVDKMPNKNKYIGGTQDNGSWLSPLNPTANSAWSSTPGGDGFEAVWNYGDLNQLLESSQFNDIYKSSNGGASWTSVTGIPKSVALAPFITRIAKSKLAPDRVLIVSKNAIYRSENFGDTWTAISMSGQPGWDGSRSQTQIKFSLADPSIIWSGRALTIGFPFFVSTDSGVTFSQTQIPSITPNASISGLATHPTDANTAYVLFSNAQKAKIIMTTDLGQTWSELSGFGSNTSSSNGFPDVAVYSLLVMPTNTNIIWAGTEIGIFESTDAGATWHYSNNGFPAVAVWEMLAFDGQVIVATHGRGIWTAPLADIVVGVETITSVIPNDYSLSQNYPNPFNPSTTINFSLPVKSTVSLIIYDVLGRKVNEVVNEELPAGIQKVIWNGLNSSGVRTSSGVYFYRLIAKAENGNQFVQSKKMILMK